MHIRNARPTDRDAIITFDHLAALEQERVELIEQAVASPDCLVAERDGQVVGYGVLEYSFNDCGLISVLYVAPPERRRGTGSSLVRALAARCRTPQVFSLTSETDDAMQTLLKR